ncbi:MAG: hypothetical protein KatS3mg015_2042 [Fimbriimonadales bacterium]|nr:MAG: hypothetical protein KatS3mg015_2042 [Fimbriimonadales bacterium]
MIGNVDLITETPTRPYLRAGVAFQDTFSDKVAPFATLGRHVAFDEGTLEYYVGGVDRPNESHIHLISGTRLSLKDGLFAGFQHTGHDVNLYFGWRFGDVSLSVWANERRKPGIAISFAR